MLFLGWPKHSGCSLKLHLVASQRLFFVGIHLLGYGATVRRGRLYPIYVGYIILSGMFQKHVLVTRYVLVIYIYNYICILLYIICVCVCVLYNYSIFFTWKYRQVVNIIANGHVRQGKPEHTRAPPSTSWADLRTYPEFTWLLPVDPNWLVVDLPLWKILVNGKDYPIYYTLSHMLHGAGIFTYIWVIYGVNVGKYSSTMEHMGMIRYDKNDIMRYE